jgi:hypothetical protein
MFVPDSASAEAGWIGMSSDEATLHDLAFPVPSQIPEYRSRLLSVRP